MNLIQIFEEFFEINFFVFVRAFFDCEVGNASVKRAGIHMNQSEFFGDDFGDGTFSGGRIAINGDYGFSHDANFINFFEFEK